MCVCVSHTIRPRCPATQSSDRLLGQCWGGLPDWPWWKNPGRSGAWPGHPSGCLYEHSFLHPSPTSQELHRSWWLGTPAPPHYWWTQLPCLWGIDLHHLCWEEIRVCVHLCFSVSVCVYLFILTYCHSWMIWWSDWPDSAEWTTDWENPHHRCHRCQTGQALPLGLNMVILHISYLESCRIYRLDSI